MGDALRGIGIEIRAGIHAGEIEVHDDGDISGIAVNLAARVEQKAATRRPSSRRLGWMLSLLQALQEQLRRR
jgi:class 3 adenylate cyclase